jgi:tungstate transport system ATP-binding protein
MMSFVETENLWQRREQRDILKNVNLKVERGEVFALIGPTGAGKTTLLRLLDLLDTPALGKIFINGADVTAHQKLRLDTRRRMAFVLQKPVVFNMNVYDNIASALRWRGLGRAVIRERVNRVLDLVALSDYKNRNARTLSGGEVQRVAIARAIAIEPEVLFLDEPTANLDPISAARTEELIADVIKRYAMTVIMATHDMLQGQRLADRIGVLFNGEMAQTGTSREVFTLPANKQVAEFTGVENIIDGVIASKDGGITTINVNGTFVEAVTDYNIGEKVTVCLRAEDITVALTKLSSSARNSLSGKISRSVLIGPFCRIEIYCGFTLVALVTKKSVEEMGLEKGKQVYASFKTVNTGIIKQ